MHIIIFYAKKTINNLNMNAQKCIFKLTAQSDQINSICESEITRKCLLSSQ
jgi:hypothetical protein